MFLHFLIWDRIICGCLLVFLLDQEFSVFGHHLCFCFGSLKVVGREQKVCCLKTDMKHNAFFYSFGCEMRSLFLFGYFWLYMSYICILWFAKTPHFLSDLLFIAWNVDKNDFLILSCF
jgi:hypothetical protein